MQEALRTQALLLDIVQEQKKLLEQAATLIESQKRENAHMRRQIDQSSATVQQQAQRLEQGGERFTQNALREISMGSRQVLKENSADAIEQVHRRTSEVLSQLRQAAEAAGEQTRRLNRAHSTMVWKSLALLAIGGVFLIAGTGTWAWNKKQEANRYQVEADLSRRITQSDIVQCGEGLCANVDLKASRAGDRKQYLPVKSR